jgi:lambda repressor-like predicted transcriptional regulator
MLTNLSLLIRRLFGGGEHAAQPLPANVQYARQYEDAARMNITALFASRLATLAVTESGVTVEGENTRVLQNAVADVWRESKKLVARILGTGGAVIVPYCVNGQVYGSIVGQERLVILNTRGHSITEAVLVADSVKAERNTVYRLAHYCLRADG